jgi:hypothetical protein
MNTEGRGMMIYCGADFELAAEEISADATTRGLLS